MTPESTVQEGYLCYSRGDFAGVFALLAPDVEITQTTDLPWGGQYRGHEGARQFFAALNQHTEAMPEPLRFFSAGAEVVVIGRLKGRARATGRPIDLDIVHLWTVRNQQIIRFAAFVDTLAMRTALGLEPNDKTELKAKILTFVIRQMKESDIDGLTKSFSRFNKQRDQYEMFWKEHQEGKRITFVAVSGEERVGYTNLIWQSDYAPFREMGSPEINSMHVIDEFQKQGIGTALIQEAERVAAAQHKEEVGIGFGLTSDYGSAQRLYPKLGYIPDGRGAQPSPWGDVLFLTKRLI